MLVNLSVKGQLSTWTAASQKALEDLGFSNIQSDTKAARLVGDYGKTDYIEIDFYIQEDQRVHLTIETSTRQILDNYKEKVAEVIKSDFPVQKSRPQKIDKAPPQYTVPAQEADEDLEDEDFDDDEVYTSQNKTKNAFLKMRKSFKKTKRKTKKSLKFFRRKPLIILMLILLPPFGIFLMYYHRQFSFFTRFLLTVITVLYFMLIWVGFLGVNTGVNQESIMQGITELKYYFSKLVDEGISLGN